MEALKNKVSLFTDEQLVQKIVAGEIELFEILIRRYNSLLYKIARTYGLNHRDAEDVMQETHFTAYTQLPSFRYEASYKTWLTKIILNKCYHKRNYGALKYEETVEDVVNQNNIALLSSDKNETEKQVVNRELATVLEQSLLQISISYRSVFVLRQIEGYSVAETADLLDITPTNVKVRLNRAKALLQKQLENYYSSAELFEFHLKYCDEVVRVAFKNIEAILL